MEPSTETSPLSNALWGFANLTLGFILLWFFGPEGPETAVGCILVGSGVLLAAVLLSTDFGRGPRPMGRRAKRHCCISWRQASERP
jgi:hypothetical protein